DQDQVNKGIKSLFDHLISEEPIQVGVDYKHNNGINLDKTTDHFIALSSLHFDNVKKQFYFLFYEPGTNNVNKFSKGINSEENRIYIENDENGNYKLKGVVSVPGDRNATLPYHRLYEVTQIRLNTTIPEDNTPDTLDQNNYSESCTETRRCY
ncbi:MAG: hypothetical protein OEW75_17015, partial [Cyclobacteriaceae bacterium]|nr:hypothetical protein [Cyclobacteriaceae bacterium]